jgi:hypothetical protein
MHQWLNDQAILPLYSQDFLNVMPRYQYRLLMQLFSDFSLEVL